MTVPSVSGKLRKVKNRSSTAPISAAGCRGRSFIGFLRKDAGVHCGMPASAGHAFACATSSASNMMWGSDYPHSESTFPQSRKILTEILAGVSDDEQAKPAPDRDPGIAGGNTARVYNFDVARLTVPAWRANLSAIDELGLRALFTETARFRSWLMC